MIAKRCLKTQFKYIYGIAIVKWFGIKTRKKSTLSGVDDEKIIRKFIKEYFVEHDAELKEKIKQLINDADFYNSSTWEDG
ncbi:hypothetical protein [Achromobacter sp.]|uniref:hypothetical protein n=1 Tax=Achromobacter sp. TaxID=134375 RepID=UPI00258B9EFC|nr:hypothetical protein [Achromobacter sp.]